MAQGHSWRFFRSGGFDQVQLDRIADWQHLDQLDPKLWAVLSCPAQGLEFDARTLQLLDSDQDGRIRLPELRAAVAWSCKVLIDPHVLLNDGDLCVDSINPQDDEGRRIKTSALQLLGHLGEEASTALRCEWFDQPARIFPPDQANGDGIITAAFCRDDASHATWQWVAKTYGTHNDRSGEQGIDQHAIEQFIHDADERLAWWSTLPTVNAIFSNEQAAVAALALRAVAAKIDDYFSRCQLIAFDRNAANYLSPLESDWQHLAKQQLAADAYAAQDLPLCAPTAETVLRFQQLNPAWVGAMNEFHAQVCLPLLGKIDHLSLAQWRDIKRQFCAYDEWCAAEPSSALASANQHELQSHRAQADVLLQRVNDDKAVAEQADALASVEKIVRYKKHLYRLMRNFVSLADFYHRDQRAIFQFGELFIDGKSTELCLRVNDAAKHAAMAGLSGCYLLYCDGVRRGSNEKIQIVAAMTGGSAGNLMVGRNGIFFDRQGNDWDATVSKIVDNPISVSDAFWTPYRRIAKLIADQAQKFASDKEKQVQERSLTTVNQSAQHVEKSALEKAEKPAPFDVAKFAGIFAAIGLAIGAIGTAVAAVISGFLSLVWWQMPLALGGVLLLISGPSMIIAYFKLRQRNLAPLLDANGWAVNTKAKITLAFGRALTHSATLPDGAQRSLHDPYAEKRSPWLMWTMLIALTVFAVMLWRYGFIQKWLGL